MNDFILEAIIVITTSVVAVSGLYVWLTGAAM